MFMINKNDMKQKIRQIINKIGIYDSIKSFYPEYLDLFLDIFKGPSLSIKIG